MTARLAHAALLGGGLLVGLVVAGCAAGNQIVSLAPPSPAPKAKDYVDQVKRWHRHGDLRADFDATLIVDAVPFSPEFQAAYVAKYLDVYKVTESGREAVTQKIVGGIGEGWVFHVETQAHTYEVTDLKPPKSIWRVTLIDDRGREVSTQTVTLDPSRPEVLQVFYPYTTIFARAWRVTFPRQLPDGSDLVGPDTKSLTLRIAGPPGSIDLIWRFKEK
jgi:hypothetical protein